MEFELTTVKEISETSRKYNLHSWSAQGQLKPKVMIGGEGVYFWDGEGKRYYDMSSQLVNLNIGHGNKKVIKAIQDQAERLAYSSPSFAIDVRSQLAKMVVELAPDNMGKVFFTLGGADANENALKIAKMVTGRYKIFSRYRSYHGSTYGAANLTGEPRRYTCEPGIPGFIKFFDPYVYRAPLPFPSEEAACSYYLGQLREQIIYEGRDAVAAIFLETITGSNGVIIPPRGYLKGIRDLCNEFGILMVCDEVMTGWGRTGEWFAVSNFAVKPDIITFAKGITCGYAPLGGVLVSKAIAAYFDEHFLSCGLTYSAHPLGCAAGIATIEYYKEKGLIGQAKERGITLGKLLETLKEKHDCVGDVRYIGLFSAIELVKNKVTKQPFVEYGLDPDKTMKKVIGMLDAKGFYTYSHENSLLVAPPLIITDQELEDALSIMDDVLNDVDKMLD
ncbi:aminotransferase class III-fold pyridoxal phosphate-dependent enzyme [Desulfosporosinus sp. PR]|uniref:aminotransferase class III-fold pyridoxal phosphate-dependent enzyme n=1 Tax=Candidatus Desulfosporosinus nitrosoreducens TaxID=3401928 RepID=UPI0027F9A6BE|nr:aminotransferase class III-fold pyridoxal phosphate-dependent enzyme [Desulfosporosinus sp. PR]MDQ7097144.1 aminotransferase class III-fold pyridoxal phosphate-dependent enzyme [Desulfosporosinus sp. PR]